MRGMRKKVVSVVALGLAHAVSVVSVVLLGSLGCGSSPQTVAATPPPVVTAPSRASASPTPAEPAMATATAAEHASQLGQLDFPVSGTPECQREFKEGMLALHSFEYDRARESFAHAIAKDATCSMAAWGEAMTHDHLLWYERDLKKARASLARITPEREAELTVKERAFIGAARAELAKDDVREGHRVWLDAMKKLHADYPDDDEIALAHAIALYAVHARASDVREQVEAGAIALEVLRRRPEHPGAAHYVIHAFDSREHAILALPAARTYARIAPAAGHALHMPSHTFTHLGMWKDVVPSNERAYAASVAWAKAQGQSPSKYDWHSYSWLVAALLELGQPVRARQLVDEARVLLEASKDDSSDLRFAYGEMVANYVSQTGRWNEVAALTAPIFAPAVDETSGSGAMACAAHAPGGDGAARPPMVHVARFLALRLRAEAAMQAGDAGALEKRVAEMKATRERMRAWSKMLPELGTRFEALEGVVALRGELAKKRGPAVEKKTLDAMEKLTRAEDARGISGPAFFFTARESYASALLAANKPKEALAQYEREIDRRPNRALSMLGAARAAKAAGDATRARAHYAALAELWKDADAEAPALAEVRTGAR
jgi:hypothetical protein